MSLPMTFGDCSGSPWREHYGTRHITHSTRVETLR